MKRLLLLCLLCVLLAGCMPVPEPVETTCPTTLPETLPTETTSCETIPTEPETEPPVPVLDLTEEEKTMLLKIGMAERGNEGCTECIALVMRTLINRVESGRFGSSIQKVLFAENQFTPVANGSYYKAEPNELCEEALAMVIYGWDESQGALYYEWCEGESWHSKNLTLLFQHCDTRFYVP